VDRVKKGCCSFKPVRAGFSMVEIIIVLVMMAVIARMALPKLNLSQMRADAAAQQVRSVFQTAQRTSLTRQYDVIVSVDTTQFALRIAEDVNNDGTIQVSEWKFWRPTGEGNMFAVPPKGLNASSVASSVVGAQLKLVDGFKSVIFHRDGSTSSDAEIYVRSDYKGRSDYRAIAVTRSTGRTELYRLSGTGVTASWLVVQ
jgi:prepilin-type N-terminal cleavage/methylation domain-containing protein